MHVNVAHSPRANPRERLIALHCSGAGTNQWNYLAEALGGRYEVLAPEPYASESSGPWTGGHALPAPRSAYRSLNFAALILRDEHAPSPTRIIAEELSTLLPADRLMVVNGAEHMRPLTHAPEVCELAVQHIGAIGDGEQAWGWRPRSLASIFGAALQPAKAVP